MYHRTKTLRETYSVRVVAEQLNISPNTVQKYSKLDLQTASVYIKNIKRVSQYDQALSFIEEEISNHPKISTTKLHRKIKSIFLEIEAKVRALRYYI